MLAVIVHDTGWSGCPVGALAGLVELQDSRTKALSVIASFHQAIETAEGHIELINQNRGSEVCTPFIGRTIYSW